MTISLKVFPDFRLRQLLEAVPATSEDVADEDIAEDSKQHDQNCRSHEPHSCLHWFLHLIVWV